MHTHTHIHTHNWLKVYHSTSKNNCYSLHSISSLSTSNALNLLMFFKSLKKDSIASNSNCNNFTRTITNLRKLVNVQWLHDVNNGVYFWPKTHKKKNEIRVWENYFSRNIFFNHYKVGLKEKKNKNCQGKKVKKKK